VPKLKLRKRLRARGQSFTVGCDYNVPDRSASFEASWRDSKIGGRLTLKNLDQLEWTKTWIMPGLTDAATRVEVQSQLDLRTGKTDAMLKLGLRRRMSKPGLSLVHEIAVDGTQGHLKLDVGATFLFPEELKLTAADVRSGSSASLQSARVEVDFDRLDLRVEY